MMRREAQGPKRRKSEEFEMWSPDHCSRNGLVMPVARPKWNLSPASVRIKLPRLAPQPHANIVKTHESTHCTQERWQQLQTESEEGALFPPPPAEATRRRLFTWSPP
jgi:hypothetical protein